MHLLGHSGGCEPISVTVCLIDWEAAKMKKVDSFGNSTLIDTNRSGLRDFRGVEESETCPPDNHRALFSFPGPYVSSHLRASFMWLRDPVCPC